MRVLTHLAAARVAIHPVQAAFYAMTTPKVPETLDAMAADPRIDHILVHPHLLFQGRLYDAIVRQCEEADGRHDQTTIVCGDYLGPTSPIAATVLQRIEQSYWPGSTSAAGSTSTSSAK